MFREMEIVVEEKVHATHMVSDIRGREVIYLLGKTVLYTRFDVCLDGLLRGGIVHDTNTGWK